MNENKFQERLLDRLDKIDNRFDKLDDRITALESSLGSLEETIAWIKGKLEGRSEVHHVVLTGISILVAIGAVIVAIFK